MNMIEKGAMDNKDFITLKKETLVKIYFGSEVFCAYPYPQKQCEDRDNVKKVYTCYCNFIVLLNIH